MKYKGAFKARLSNARIKVLYSKSFRSSLAYASDGGLIFLKPLLVSVDRSIKLKISSCVTVTSYKSTDELFHVSETRLGGGTGSGHGA